MIWLIGVLFLMLLGIVFLLWQNNHLHMDEYFVESPNLPEELDGCRIVHISDLHNKRFGEDQKRLVQAMEKAEPDLVLITGDLIDKRRTKEEDWENALALVRHSAELAPVFFVSGNHEWESGYYKKFQARLETMGAEVLDNGFVVLDHGETSMAVLGLSDPANYLRKEKRIREQDWPELEAKLTERLAWLCEQQEEGTFQILLSHRPQLLDFYAKANIPLVFCGHAHGGQIRLPFIGALYAPDQGWLPKYTEGPYIQDNTVMIVSRGLGNSGFPFRVFNQPQLVVLTLKVPGEDEELDETLEVLEEEGQSEFMETPAENEAFSQPEADMPVQEEPEPEPQPEEEAVPESFDEAAVMEGWDDVPDIPSIAQEVPMDEPSPASIPVSDEEEDEFKKFELGEFPPMNELPEDLPQDFDFGKEESEEENTVT